MKNRIKVKNMIKVMAVSAILGITSQVQARDTGNPFSSATTNKVVYAITIKYGCAGGKKKHGGVYQYTAKKKTKKHTWTGHSHEKASWALRLKVLGVCFGK